MLCVLFDQPAADLSGRGAVPRMVGLWVLPQLDPLDDPDLPDGLCRLLHEEEQMVGTADPLADDRIAGVPIQDVFRSNAVFLPAPSVQHDLLRGDDAALRAGDLQREARSHRGRGDQRRFDRVDDDMVAGTAVCIQHGCFNQRRGTGRGV